MLRARSARESILRAASLTIAAALALASQAQAAEVACSFEGGVLVAPREIEDCLYRLPEVAEVAVLGLPDERWGEAITAVIVVHPDQQLTAETVRRTPASAWPTTRCPSAWSSWPSWPRNQSGKLLKRELRAQRTAPRD